MSRLANFLKPSTILLLLTTIFFITFVNLSFSLHDGLKSSNNDIGYAAQALHNTLNGHFMKTGDNVTGQNTEPVNLFSLHANFIILLFVPLYYVFYDPKILLISQIFIVSMSVIPLYLLSKQLFKNGLLTILIPILFLVNPLLHDTILYDVQFITFAIPLSLFAFYFLYNQKHTSFLISLFLLLILKEDTPLLVAMFGGYMAYKKNYKLGLSIICFSIVYFFVINAIVMPNLNVGGQVGLVQRRYSHLGDGFVGIFKNFATHPWYLVTKSLSIYKLISFIILLFPLAYLPLLSPTIFFLSAPSLMINMLSSNAAMQLPFYYYYQAPILPFMFLAALFSLEKIKKYNKQLFKGVVLATVLSSTAMSIIFSPIPYSLTAKRSDYEITDHEKNIKQLKSIIPPNKSLSVQNNLGGHFANRYKTYTFPFQSHNADYVLVDVSDPYENIQFFPRQRNFMYINQLLISDYAKEIESLYIDNNYSVYHFTNDGFIIFKRNHSSNLNSNSFNVYKENINTLENRYRNYL